MSFSAKFFLAICVLAGSVLHSKNAEWWSRIPLIQPKVPWSTQPVKENLNRTDRTIIHRARSIISFLRKIY